MCATASSSTWRASSRREARRKKKEKYERSFPAQLGAVGIWAFQLDYQPPAKPQEAGAELEQLGFGAIWLPEAAGREVLTNAGLLLARPRRIAVATGIASIYARGPMAMAAAENTLAEAYPDRFVLGLGVGHAPLVEQFRGHQYEKLVPTMRVYLDAMDGAPYQAVLALSKPRRVLAALGPKMLQLAAERTSGAHPYFVPPEHTVKSSIICALSPKRTKPAGRKSRSHGCSPSPWLAASSTAPARSASWKTICAIE